MAEWRKYNWVFPIIGGIFTLISIATPVASFSYMGESANLWIFGYWVGSSYLGQGLVDDIQVNINGYISAKLTEGMTEFVICFFGVLIGGIIALIVGVRGFRGNFRKRLALLSGILMILFTFWFVWLIGLSYEVFSNPILSYEDPYGDISLSLSNLGLGLIGPFIGGAFCLAGGLIRTKPRIE